MPRGRARELGLLVSVLIGSTVAVVGGACDRRPPGGPPPSLGPVTEVPDLEAPEGCATFSARTLMQCIDRERIERDVRSVARPRPPGSAQHEAVRQLCAVRLAAAGYDVRHHDYGTGVNVLGIKRGFTKADEQVVISAHYDHLEGCPGADDNGSGVAVVLETARVLSQARFDRTLVVACWDEAERGQLGSTAYAQQAHERGDDIVAVFAYEAVGYATDEPDTQRLPERFDERFPDQALALLDNRDRADFVTIVAERGTARWAHAVARQGRAIGLTVHVLTLRGASKQKLSETYRADHTSFWEVDYPALLLTDTGSYRNERIHCKQGRDTADTLNYRFAGLVARAGVGALVELLELR